MTRDTLVTTTRAIDRWWLVTCHFLTDYCVHCFPIDVRTHPLLIIDFELLQTGDSMEIDRLWEAATSIGFW